MVTFVAPRSPVWLEAHRQISQPASATAGPLRGYPPAPDPGSCAPASAALTVNIKSTQQLNCQRQLSLMYPYPTQQGNNSCASQ